MQPCMTGSYKDDHLYKKKRMKERKKKRGKGAFRAALARLTGTCCAAECRRRAASGEPVRSFEGSGCVYGEWWKGECAASHQHSWRHRSLKWAALQTVKKRRGERRNVQAPLRTLNSCAQRLKWNKCRFKLLRNHLHRPAGILFHPNSRWTRSVCRVETLLLQRGR